MAATEKSFGCYLGLQSAKMHLQMDLNDVINQDFNFSREAYLDLFTSSVVAAAASFEGMKLTLLVIVADCCQLRHQ